MMNNKTYKGTFIGLLLLLLCCLLLNLSLGTVHIPIKDIIASITLGEVEKSSWKFIVQEYRIPKAITAIVAGGGLALAGLLMQTLFRNPLAGPYVLGLSSGASLGVALLILGAGAFSGFLGSTLLNEWSLIIASALGSFLVLLAVLAVTFRVKDTMAILIIGLMFGSVTGAIVAVLSYFSNAEKLQQFIFWSFGSLGNQSWSGIYILLLAFSIGVFLSIRSAKALNALLLGEQYATSLGLKMKQKTFIIIIATSILAGSITAFAGPIAFVGLAVPHLTRQFIKTSNHILLIPAVTLAGAILMLLCDTIAQVPYTDYALPINAVTSIVGAPVVIWLLVRKKKLHF